MASHDPVVCLQWCHMTLQWCHMTMQWCHMTLPIQEGHADAENTAAVLEKYTSICVSVCVGGVNRGCVCR